MHIQIADEPFLDLTAWWIASEGMEFSGLGLVERQLDVLNVVGVDLLNVGSFGYTEIPAHRQMALPLDPRRKLWFHRHPMGQAKPGPHNWSGTDHATAELSPLGGIPQLVQWSTSMVFTPSGWTGRVDIYLPTLKTYYIPVYPTVPTPEQQVAAYERVTPELLDYVHELKDEFAALMRTNRHPIYNEAPQENYDWGGEEEIEGLDEGWEDEQDALYEEENRWWNEHYGKNQPEHRPVRKQLELPKPKKFIEALPKVMINGMNIFRRWRG